MNSKKITEQILKDFSLNNYDNLFRGETRSDQSVWYVIKPNIKRKNNYSLSSGEFKYGLTYNIKNYKLWVGSYHDAYSDLLNDDDKKKVLSLLAELDEKYEQKCKEYNEQRKTEFLQKTFAL